MAISHQASSGVEAATTAKGSTSTTVAYTGVAAGRMAILMVALKLGTAPFSSVDPTGWQRVVDLNGGTGTTGDNVGQTRLGCWWRVLEGNETGNVTILGVGSECMGGGMSVYSGTLGAWGNPIAVTGDDATHGANRSNVCGAWSSALAANDFVVLAWSSDFDSTTAYSAPTITQTSATFGTVNIRNQRLSSNGNDCGMLSADASVTTGNANAPTIGFTWASASCGPGAAIRLRELSPGTPPHVVVARYG